MDLANGSTAKEWAAPKSVKGVQTFLGFANFNRRLIKYYSEIVSPLIALTKKGIKFLWSPEAEAAFQSLKTAFTSAPVLIHFDPEKPIIVETDASYYVSTGVLSRHDDEGILHLVAFPPKEALPRGIQVQNLQEETTGNYQMF